MIKKVFFVVNFILIIFFIGMIRSDAAEKFEDILKRFPVNYQNSLRKLHDKYPYWEFKPLNIDINFNEAVKKEASLNRSLVPINSSEYIKSNEDGDYIVSLDSYMEKDHNWVSATLPFVSYFVDPANFLNEKHIFQFEDLTFDKDIHTKEGVEAILKGSFMYQKRISYLNLLGDLEETSRTYSGEIMKGAKTYDISPYYLASKIRQEVGSSGSGSSFGNFLGFQGIYNFYNINAYDSSNPIANGLKWASDGSTYKRPWITPALSIVGGAGYISKQFINNGQYTNYLQRFNVGKSSYPKYTHQYMTNIVGAASESMNNYKAYVTNNLLNSKKVFWIPVYKNYNINTKVSFNLNKHIGVTLKDVSLMENAGKSNILTKIPKDTEVSILEGTLFNEPYNYSNLIDPYFYKIKYKNSVGFVSADDISIKNKIILKVGETYKLNYTLIGTENIYFQSSNRRSVEVEKGVIKAQDKGSSEIRIFVGKSMDSIEVEVI